jgi:threonine/homoserine/homoserine lactone efflux protein
MVSTGQIDCLVRSVLVGGVFGFVVAIPVGPVNLTVVDNAVRKGFLSAFMAGVGAMVAETFYASLMLAGHSTILDRPPVAYAMQGVAVVVIGYLGIRSLLVKTDQFQERSAATAERVGERWHHPKSLLLGFILTISNLGLLLLWGALGSFLLAHEWIRPSLSSRTACAAGVFTGGVVWFFLLSFFVSRAHRRIKPRALMLLVRGCGIVFLVIACLLVYRLFVPSHHAHGVDIIRGGS